MDIYQLTKEQQSAFNALKRAANKCEKLNIGFVNIYGTINAFDRELIERFDVDAKHEVDCGKYGYPSNTIDNLGGDSYADDQLLHSFKLTEKGRKIFQEEL